MSYILEILEPDSNGFAQWEDYGDEHQALEDAINQADLLADSHGYTVRVRKMDDRTIGGPIHDIVYQYQGQ